MGRDSSSSHLLKLEMILDFALLFDLAFVFFSKFHVILPKYLHTLIYLVCILSRLPTLSCFPLSLPTRADGCLSLGLVLLEISSYKF